MDPYKYRCRWCATHNECSLDCLNNIEDVIKFEGAHTIAAVIIEPVTGSNGIIIPSPDYLRRLKSLCEKNNILLIADEVMSGFGRTGKWFAVNNWDVQPDIITMAKGLTSGYFPLSAVAVSGQIADYYEHNVLNLGSTYNAHPVGCAVAVECIKIYQSDNLIENSAKLGKILANKLEKMKIKHSIIGDVRSIGLFAAIEFVQDKNTKTPLIPFAPNQNELKPMINLKNFLLEKGLFLASNNNFLIIAPPLCITEEQLLEGLNLIDMAITSTLYPI
jgi:taurine--2-oxoglutarate transaminase